VKFTPAHGSVTVEARQQEREGRQGALVVITDSGPGIAPAEQLRVFDRFYQVDPSARRRHGGMGLGLALVRSTVERHGGAVWLESLPGVGSAFFVWLPADTEGGTEQACAPGTPA
jgi:signal transduction histidine kinase